MPPRKRRAVEFGAPTQEDRPNAQVQLNDPTSSSVSTRNAPGKLRVIPTLVTYSGRCFAAHLDTIFTNERFDGDSNALKYARPTRLQKAAREWLLNLPDHLVQRLFTMLRVYHPTKLSTSFIAEYFMRGDSLRLTGELTGVTRATLVNVASKMTDELKSLELVGLERIADEDFGKTIAQCERLETLVLRGSAKAGAKTAAVIAQSCPSLKVLNLNYTAVPPSSLANVAISCRQLEVLKVAGLPKFTDNALGEFVKRVKVVYDEERDKETPQLPLANLRSLKLRLNTVSGSHLPTLLSMTPVLSRLDLSFTGVQHLSQSEDFPIPPLQKLMLTSTRVDISDLVHVVAHLPLLKKLHLGALGAGAQGSSIPVNSTSLTLSDSWLAELTAVLSENCLEIEEISLAQNSKLGSKFGPRSSAGALRNFIKLIGRNCKKLNLSGTSLQSSDLDGLIPELLDPVPSAINHPIMIPSGDPRLESLILNNTRIDNDAAEALSACKHLETLELSGTGIGKDGLFQIIDSCTKLGSIDLTSCRGVRVTERRDFFRIWEDERRDL